MLIPGLLILVAVVVALFLWNRKREQVLWAHQVGIPEIERLVELGQNRDAFDLAQEVEAVIANDTVPVRLWPQFSTFLTIHSEPDGDDVFVRPYTEVDGEWTLLGRTPIDSVRYPIV